ncbi:MAG: hypothetical protein ACKOYC_10390 [Bacteroidota bacterium]
MSIEVKMVRSRKESEAYIRLPYRIYNGYRYYVPPLLRDERRFHDPAFNLSLGTCDTIRLLAYRNGSLVGRIMGIIHHGYNSSHDLKDVRFFQLDCIDDYEVASKLVQAVEQWGQALGMSRIIGPFGFSDKDPQGIQIEGQSVGAVISSATNPPYIASYIHKMGFSKFKDCVSYLWSIRDQLPEIYERVADRIRIQGGFELIEFESRNQFRVYFKPVMELLNSGYDHIFGFVPMDEREIETMAKEYLGFINPRFVKMILKNQQPVAFVIAMPNLADGFKKANGHLWPIGFLHLLKSYRTSNKLDLLLGAVQPKYQKLGLTSLLAISLIKEACKSRFKTMDSHLILEENHLMCAEMERLGAQLTKRYRIFEKNI